MPSNRSPIVTQGGRNDRRTGNVTEQNTPMIGDHAEPDEAAAEAPDDREYARALGSRLRAVRSQQRLSLHGVEQKSGGRWKAVVVGSYERGDRAVTVQKLAELADFYGVPVAELLPEGRVPSGSEPATKIVINLERLQQLPADKVGPLARYAAAIQSQRGDYNGKVLSI